MHILDFGKKKYSETKRLIRQAMSEKQLVLFVGAGASADVGMPLWGEVVSQIAEKLNLNDKDYLDNLIIPQYYYNARGRKEYTQLMREIFRFNDKLYPGDIQNAIIKFDVETIITTNYDHLIEDAAENNGKFLYVVSQDSDLSYRKAGKELIKMHGDFEHDNFVLKEDDYLHYHKKFKLIENYVKSLIGTKTVLFIGYSLSDLDVKHIFSWVKEILDEHFQRAYLIMTGKSADQNEIEYFKHLGVNIIYATELFDENDISCDDQSGQLLQTLYYFLDDEEKQRSIIDSLYSDLKPFVSLHYTYRKYIERAFNRLRNNVDEKITVRLENDNYLRGSYAYASESDKAFMDELEHAVDGKPKNQEWKIIAEVLRKSAVRGICSATKKDASFPYDRKEFWDKEPEPEWIEAINNFDYRKLNQLKEYNYEILSESKPELYLQQAYICSFLEDYLGAYYCLDNAVNYFYRKREYSWYFISLWNKKNIARIITQTMYNSRISEDILKSIKNDYDAIDLEKTLQTIPDLGNDNNRFLRDLKDFKFASDLFYDVVSNSMKISAQATETYALFAGLPAYEETRQQVYDYYRYGIHNCLMVDKYRENIEIFNLFTRSIFSSASAPDKNISNGEFFENAGNIHVDSLNEIDIHLILRYINSEQLRKLFKEFNITIIKVNESGKEYLGDIIENIPAVFGLDLFRGTDIFWKYICFVSHTSLDEKQVFSILRVLVEVKELEFVRSKRVLLDEFVNSIYRQELYKKKEICEEVRKLVKKFIQYISNLNGYRTTIISLISFCEEGGVLFEDEDAIKKILSEEYYVLLIEMYRGCADNVKTVIKSALTKWECPNTSRGYQIYSELVLAGIIAPNKKIEEQACNFLVKHNADKKKERKQGIRTYPKDELEIYLINLYLSDAFLSGDRLKKIVQEGEEKFSKWLIDMEGYDYSEFDVSWLKKCYPSLLEKISENKKVKALIIKVYKEKYSSGHIDNRINEIVIHYFI